MPPPELPQLPFLTRDMLPFGFKMKLELVVRSNQTTQRTVEIRGITRESKINIKHVGTSTTTFTETTTQIGDFPIFLAVAPQTVVNSHGDLYVSVSLRIDGDISIPLVAGYVTTTKGLSWPNTNLGELVPGHGHTRAIQITQPSAGAEFAHTITANRVIHIRSLSFKLVTDANAADRKVTLKFVHDGATTIVTAASAPTPASATVFYTFAPGGESLSTRTFDTIFAPLPVDLWLNGEDTIASLTQLIQVGDQFSAIAINVDEYFDGA